MYFRQSKVNWLISPPPVQYSARTMLINHGGHHMRIETLVAYKPTNIHCMGILLEQYRSNFDADINKSGCCGLWHWKSIPCWWNWIFIIWYILNLYCVHPTLVDISVVISQLELQTPYSTLDTHVTGLTINIEHQAYLYSNIYHIYIQP